MHVAAAAPARGENNAVPATPPVTQKVSFFLSRFGKFPGVSNRSFVFSASFPFILAFSHGMPGHVIGLRVLGV